MIIKALDCTLRDGGYVNLWNFGAENISKIVHNLTESRVEFIELGFLKPCQYDINKTLFNSVADFDKFIPQSRSDKTLYLGMITFGQYDLSLIPERKNTNVNGFRIIFKKPQWKEALEYCKEVKEKGYKIFINPMHTYNYSDRELLDLVDGINEVMPYGMSIVDTMGIMKSQQLLHIFSLIDSNLNSKIGICFHSHNNLQLSFSNAQALLSANTKRELIIDASVRGMGRGAGNLCTELLLQYLNDNFDKKYNLIPILKIIDEQIDKIYATNPWGYNVPYYLAATMKCHPNYASFLTDKASISVESMSEILALIPENKKANYDERLIQELYLRYQENEVNDTYALETLKNNITNREVLIIAPGKSINLYKDKILSYIKEKKPYVISINFRPEAFNVDNVFISNARRFSEQTSSENVLVTSNIKAENVITFNYGSYLNNSEMADNSCLMLLKILIKSGIKNVVFAGMDGFSNGNDNYFDPSMVNNAKLGEFDKRNEVMHAMLKSFEKSINMTFLTTSLYEKEHEVQDYSVGY